jgi:hypothetical protein
MFSSATLEQLRRTSTLRYILKDWNKLPVEQTIGIEDVVWPVGKYNVQGTHTFGVYLPHFAEHLAARGDVGKLDYVVAQCHIWKELELQRRGGHHFDPSTGIISLNIGGPLRRVSPRVRVCFEYGRVCHLYTYFVLMRRYAQQGCSMPSCTGSRARMW